MTREEVGRDIAVAHKIISGKYKNKNINTFHNVSSIYRGTNECMCSLPYYETLKNNKNVLSVIASGDQIINSILLGTKNITGYDISIFPKYYLMLKLAGLKVLSQKEFVSFFLGRADRDLFNLSTYKKIRCELDDNSLFFWDSIFYCYDREEICESTLFSKEFIDRGISEHNNPYLRGDNYNKAKSNIRNLNIRFLEGNIFDLVKKDIGSFDFINLSNIIQYSNEYFGTKEKDTLLRYKEFLKSLPLEDNGVALSYLFGISSFFKLNKNLEEIFSEEEFSIKQLKLNTFNDGILLYQKKK